MRGTEESIKGKWVMGHFVISFSGGLDSTALILFLIAREREQGRQQGHETRGTVRAVSFDYGQKHRVELECGGKNVKLIASLTGVDIVHQVVDLRGAFCDSVSSLSADGEAIPQGHYADENMKSTVVENRNVIFSAVVYGKALSLSKRLGEDVTIALGIHQGDHTIYPDCRPESYELAKELFRISNWGSERVHYEAPFLRMDKGAVLGTVVQSLALLGLSSHFEEILANTNTCYTPSATGEACGRCGACSERLSAFESLGLKDPVRVRESLV